ncbi:hypothetical protein DCAR_0518481 [Daucus carota subsp. sativus]|uniref:Uncharacterized protein n=1 Tax=Daucus carota subsp. sativus TaxID=79200 RepID=A0AAF1AXI4_DAUCS|nr:hypothetical protein DCAR_0518481 [Daucus carota subsp. sativus]
MVFENVNDRSIIFSSFHPEAALLLQKCFLPYKRRNGKLQFREKEFPGGSAEILLKRFSEVKDVYRNPAAASKIKKSNLYLFTYGKLNNVPDAVYIQYMIGIEGVTVDLVQVIT